MTLQLEEGQSFANRFTLLHKLQVAPSGASAAGIHTANEVWLGMDALTNERVCLKFLANSLDQSQYDKLTDDIGRTHALIHPNISRTYDLHTSSEGVQFIVSQYRDDTSPLELHPASHKYQLAVLSPALDALEYAHSLNLVHGNLNLSNVLIDASGNAYLAEFGLVDLEPAAAPESVRSPQVKAGLLPESKDDIYSLGALFYQLITGSRWDGTAHSLQTDFPLPKQMQSLVLSMLSDAPYNRPGSIAEIRSVLNDYLNYEDNILESHDTFSKPSVAPAMAAPATSAHQPLSTRETRVVPTSIVIPVLFILLISAGLVFVYLPDSVEPVQLNEVVFDQTPPADMAPTANVEESSNEPAPFQLALLEQLKKESGELAAQLLRQQIYLEDQGIHLWAPDLHKEVQDKAEQGDTLFRAENYADSISSFQEGIEILNQLSASAASVKASHLESGQDALNAGDSNAAQRAFEIALAIEPGNPAAQEGTARALKLDEVLALVENAIASENDNDLEAALLTFEQASSIDPKWVPAADGYTRVKDNIRKRNFNRTMSVGFAALDREQFGEARDAFNQAQTILPESSEPADALQQIDLVIRLKQIAEHRGKAVVFEAGENWQQAAGEYSAVLELDPTLLFASEGKAQANQRADLAGRLNGYISTPVLLNDNDHYLSAQQVVTQAEKITRAGPLLSRQLTDLNKLIELARMPLQVELKSDKLTDVTVYRVGQLGRLESTQLTLYPGTYRVVGKRRGYRDVQQEFTLIAGQSAPAIFVSCTEKI